MTPTHPPRPSTDDGHDDDALRRALRALPAEPAHADAAAEAALQRRVLAGWAAARTATRARPVLATATGTSGAVLHPPGAGDRPRGWRLTAAGLAVLVALAAWFGLQRPDPTVDELMRLDVLSQIAAGEL